MLSVQNSVSGIIVARYSRDEIKEATEFAQDTAQRFKVPVNNYLLTN